MLTSIWNIILALAPWLLVGMAVAGVLHVVLPEGFVVKQLRGRLGVIKAVAFGVPMPLCSCGVIPAGIGLKKDGASDGAAIGFLISTPQTGVDSILVSASFLGLPFALFKLVSAAVTGVVGGLLAERLAPSGPNDAKSGVGGSDASSVADRGWRDGVDHAVQVLRSIWRWILFGILASALIDVYLPESYMETLGSFGTVGASLVALAISVPLYVCATASVPIAAVLVAGGMPTGAALVFLMAGPATNIATMGAVYRTFGGKLLAVYLATIVVGSMVLAVAFEWVIRVGDVTTTMTHNHASVWATMAGACLCLMMLWFAVDELKSKFAGRANAGLDDIVLGVQGMTCGGCSSRLERLLQNEEGVQSVVVDLDAARATVAGNVSEERVRTVIEQAGFTVGGQ